MKPEFAAVYQDLDNAYKNLIASMQELVVTKVACQNAKENLESAISMDTVNGAIQGKNTEERKASARNMHSNLFSLLEGRESDLVQAESERDVNETEVKRLWALVRIWEMNISIARIELERDQLAMQDNSRIHVRHPQE